jgi:Lon protease-like protein
MKFACDDSGMRLENGQHPAPIGTLPLFPLGTVVFPGTLLPLQIFELRYLQMVGECERQGTHFGVVTLTRGGEVHQPGGPQEQFEPIGTRMRLEKVQRPRPGLLHIACRALGTFEVIRTHQRSDGLWLGEVHDLPPEPALPVPDHLQYLSEQMADALTRLQDERMDPPPWPRPWASADCAWLSQRWGELLPLPPATKYRLLALREPLLRLELIGDMVSPQTPQR